MLSNIGVLRNTRNGDAIVSPHPVTTVYSRPAERLAFWPQRDTNIAFLVYEALWLLAGRDDVAPLTRYISEFGRYSDDGKTLWGSYGARWRTAFGRDQLQIIIERLTRDPDDRRCVLAMWDPPRDLGGSMADHPCNTHAYVTRNAQGDLDLTVCNRSNDIVWGAYFANAFSFSVLQEYLAAAIGCGVGTYYQVSNNYHCYQPQFEELKELPRLALDRGVFSVPTKVACPYEQGHVVAIPLLADGFTGDAAAALDGQIRAVLVVADTDFRSGRAAPSSLFYANGVLMPFFAHAYAVLHAHHLWRTLAAPERFERAIEALAWQELNQRCDWVVAMRQWLQRRQARWEAKMAREKTSAAAV